MLANRHPPRICFHTNGSSARVYTLFSVTCANLVNKRRDTFKTNVHNFLCKAGLALGNRRLCVHPFTSSVPELNRHTESLSHRAAAFSLHTYCRVPSLRPGSSPTGCSSGPSLGGNDKDAALIVSRSSDCNAIYQLQVNCQSINA